MLDLSSKFVASLKDRGYSLTAARQMVFGALQHHEPLSMSELVAACAGIDRASVYRAVALFERLGIVHRLQIGWKYKLELSDDYHYHHHHLTCNRCCQVAELPEDAGLENKFKKIAAAQGYLIENHQLEIQGLCPTCQNLKTRTV